MRSIGQPHGREFLLGRGKPSELQCTSLQLGPCSYIKGEKKDTFKMNLSAQTKAAYLILLMMQERIFQHTFLTEFPQVVVPPGSQTEQQGP